LHPNKTAIFAFDNSQNHHAMADNALIASRLNLSDGLKAASGGSRKRVIMRNGYYYDDDDNKIVQSMMNEDGGQKGIKRILLDRGLWREGIKLDQARELLNNEPDFIEQSRMPWLKEIVTKANHMFIFFPKFHPEFNFIERYWGLAKRYARSKCAYSFKELETIVPEAILSISLTNIRRFYNHSWRYIEAYHTGNLQPHQVEWAMKKYTSHRRIRETDPDIVLPGFLTPEFSQEMPR
jgi:transposase